ncbi:MAG TPA: TIGR03960 family B12-binding radical SAM protein [Phycisphaerae bacterium]|nr:TIGR03960 family B12-binding radical SAM protein [Phycisphaerae bacterium]HOI54504.1 TIGR03960 family B12-binding radical SAM protein [Phycisphaerae bacterium]
MNHRTDLGEAVSRDILPFVTKPSQYIGGEVNAAPRIAWDAASVRFCLAFPDTYAIGVSHHGSAILHEMLNDRPGTLCDRTFLPWPDAQDRMRAASVPLWSWQLRRPVRRFDLLGISLQYELLYTSTLNLLELAGVPLRASERTEADPLVLAGGPGPNNPEPMAAFIDLYLIGDAEEALPAVLDAFEALKRDEPDLPRQERIARLASALPCLYAPAFYEPEYGPDGRFVALRRTRDGLPERITAAHVADLDAAPSPVRPVVPFGEGVHERLTIEIMRGCPRRCRFCEAGHTKGKLRLRSPERILDIARRGIAATGYEEISLLSLSSSDHPQLHEILRLLDGEFRKQNVSLALPSLRTNEQLATLPGLLSQGRKSGLTLVPEAATERLRRAIAKDVDEQHLVDGAREAFRRGWNLLKLYFMVGLPGERPEDIDGIIALSVRLAHLREEFAKGPARINVAVSTFIPRPHTPLQWAPMADEAYIQSARARLRELAQPHRYLSVKFHHVERSLLEGVLSRADRRMGDVIEAAYRAGATLDAWNETFDFSRWTAALRQVGLDAAEYQRGREPDEPLPWSHIDMGLPADHLLRQYERTLATLADEG